jgi:hypothetical protein
MNSPLFWIKMWGLGSEVTKSEGQVRDIKGKITERSETGNKKRKKNI